MSFSKYPDHMLRPGDLGHMTTPQPALFADKAHRKWLKAKNVRK